MEDSRKLTVGLAAYIFFYLPKYPDKNRITRYQNQNPMDNIYNKTS